MGLKATVDKLTTSTGKFIQSFHSTEYMYLLCEVKEFRTNQIFLKYRHDSKEFLKNVLVKLIVLQISTVSKILKSPLKSAFGISWLWGLRLEELKRQKKNMCQSNSKLGFAHASYCVIKASAYLSFTSRQFMSLYRKGDKSEWIQTPHMILESRPTPSYLQGWGQEDK